MIDALVEWLWEIWWHIKDWITGKRPPPAAG
jgi:hypothetical protein